MSSTLYWSPYSPYVRKVVVALRELHLESTVVKKPATSSPVKSTVEHDAWNPSGKVPVLVLPNNRGLFGSQVILQYLDSISTTKKIIPGGPDRFDELILESYGDAVLDAALLLRYETFARPEELRWNEWITGQQSKITRAISKIAERVPGTDNDLYKLPESNVETLSLGGITAASACWYLDFRFPDIKWREGEQGARLAKWYSQIQSRTSWADGEN